MWNDYVDFVRGIFYLVFGVLILAFIIITYYSILIFGLLYIGYLTIIEKVQSWKFWKKNS